MTCEPTHPTKRGSRDDQVFYILTEEEADQLVAVMALCSRDATYQWIDRLCPVVECKPC